MDAFFVFILGYLINGERIVPIELLGIFICFGCVFVISQSDQKSQETGEVDSQLTGNRTLGVFLSLIFAFLIGITAVFNRTLKETPTSVIMFYHGLGGLIPVGAYILIETALSETGMRMMSYSP